MVILGDAYLIRTIVLDISVPLLECSAMAARQKFITKRFARMTAFQTQFCTSNIRPGAVFCCVSIVTTLEILLVECYCTAIRKEVRGLWLPILMWIRERALVRIILVKSLCTVCHHTLHSNFIDVIIIGTWNVNTFHHDRHGRNWEDVTLSKILGQSTMKLPVEGILYVSAWY